MSIPDNWTSPWCSGTATGKNENTFLIYQRQVIIDGVFDVQIVDVEKLWEDGLRYSDLDFIEDLEPYRLYKQRSNSDE